MKALVLAATHAVGINSRGVSVPRPLVDLEGRPLLTVLVERLRAVTAMTHVTVVTNESLLPALQEWTGTLPRSEIGVDILSDGTTSPEDSLGATGDIVFAIRERSIDDDLLIVGGDNFFRYSLSDFLDQSKGRTPAVVVTRLSGSERKSRFGMVEKATDGSIARFIEKPKEGDLGLKASCVYVFGRGDLHWFDDFAQENDTHCSPGKFLQWLVGQTSVHAVELDASWYDIGGSDAEDVHGPDALRLIELVRELANPSLSTWEREASRRLLWISSYRDLLDALNDRADPNMRIVAARILGRTRHLLNSEGLESVRRALHAIENDPTQNEITYAGFQEDDETAVTVGESARAALRRLEG